MSPADKWFVAGVFLGLFLLGRWMVRQASARDNPPKRVGGLTRWQDGR